MDRWLVSLAVALGWFAMSDVAAAACTAESDAKLVERSLEEALRCRYQGFRSGPGACARTPPPACAGTLVADATALAHGNDATPAGEVDGAALRDQLACQRRIGKAVSRYVGTKLRDRTAGKTEDEAEARAVRQLDRLADDCAVTVARDVATQVVLPAVGPQCAAAIPAPGGVVHTASLRDCLRQLLEVWVARSGPDPQPLRPNILFILTDDQRWDTTDDTHSPVPGASIMPRVRAELADSGVEFVNAFVTTPLCCPSRASILRGQYAHATGIYTNNGTHGGADDFVPIQGETVGTLLQAAGYRTGFLGKYLNGYSFLWPNPTTPWVPPGWSLWGAFRNVEYFHYGLVENGVRVDYEAAEADYSTDVLREKAKQFISDGVAAGQPFFLHLSFKAPHAPWEPAPRHVGKFAGLAPWRPASHNEPDVSDKPSWLQNTPQLSPTAVADLDAIRIAQLEMLQAVDEAIGGSATFGITGIMQHLRNLGVADDTLVVYFSDNGWQWGEHRTEAKSKPYEESIRAPMFVRYPKLVPLPRREHRFALNLDFAPTFVELALRGGDPEPTISFDGASLVRLLDGTAPSWRRDFLTEGWPGTHVWASLREQRFKYTELPLLPGDPSSTFEQELYDLEADPLELDNLAADPAYATLVGEMAARIRELRPAWPDDSDATEEGPDE